MGVSDRNGRGPKKILVPPISKTTLRACPFHAQLFLCSVNRFTAHHQL